MLKLPVDSIISKIHAETGISTDDIGKQINNKIKELDGLVSEEGAAFIVASELGVRLLQDNFAKSLNIKDAAVGMKGIDVSGTVTAVYPVKSFAKGVETREVGTVKLKDDTGEARVVLWDDKPQLLREGKIARGSVIRIKGVMVKEGRTGGKELHVGMRSSVIVSSVAGAVTNEKEEAETCNISAVKPDMQVSLLAEIVSLFEPKFYPTCTVCNRKVIPAPEGFLCQEHKLVPAKDSMLLSFHLDDGTGTIRAVAFGNTAENLCGSAVAEIKAGGLDAIEKINERLLGRTISAFGRVKENKNFSRMEIVLASANIDPDPKALVMKSIGATSG